MPDALLLDWEGCIVDTVLIRGSALQHALRDEGLALGDEACVRCCEGASTSTSAHRALALLHRGDPVLADLIAVRASRGFAERLGKGFVMNQGASQLVANAQLSSRLAIVTRATRSETEFVLRLAGLDGAVSTIVSADDDLAPLPSPDGFLAAIAQLSRRGAIRPDHSVALGTNPDVLRSARTAGLRTIAIAVPAHVALDADGAVDALDGLTVDALSRIAGIPAVERSA